MEKYNNLYFNHDEDFSKVIGDIYKEKYDFNDELDNIHKLLDNDLITDIQKDYYKNIPIFGKTDRKSFLVQDFYKYYDSNDIIKSKYIDFIKKYIKPIFNNDEILYQTTPNIRFHLPNCTNIGKRDTDPNSEIIGLHCDSEFNHPETEINIILPITDMYDTNSIYFNNIENTLNYKDYNNLNINKNQIYLGYFNKINHYNRINETNKTRVSFDFRIILKSMYLDTDKTSVTNKTKFKIGDYYSYI